MESLKKLILANKVLMAIILLSAFFRLYRIDGYMEFLGDQGRDVVIIKSFLTNGNLMFIGPQTSIGNMYLGPWYYYLVAPSLLLALFNPIGPAILVALFGVLTSYLLYQIGKEYFNKNTGLIAAFLFSISPVIIKYTSFSWNPNIMPLFSLLFVYYFSKKRWVLSALSFVMVLNSHYLGLLLVFPAIYLLISSKDKPSPRSLIVPSIVIFIGFLPLILFDIKHHGQNINNIITFFSIRQETVNIKPYKAIPNLIPLASQILTRSIAGKEEFLGKLLLVFSLIITPILLLKEQNKKLLLILVWVISGIFGLSLYKQHIYDHYFGFLFPGICLLFGYLFSSYKKLGIILVVFVTLASLKNSHLWYLPNNQLYRTQAISQQILADSQGQPFNLALLAKQNYDPPYRYFLSLYKAKLLEINNQKTDQLYVICEEKSEDCKVLGNPEYNVAAFGIAKIAKQWQVDNITIYKLVPDKI